MTLANPTLEFRKKATVQTSQCVACGSCLTSCPRSAITVKSGVYAGVNSNKCVGCGKCKIVCPASVITILEVPA